MYVERLTQQSIAPQPVPTYADPGHDELFIEDQSGRVRLVGDKIAAGGPLANKCVTGAVVGAAHAASARGTAYVATAPDEVPTYSVSSALVWGDAPVHASARAPSGSAHAAACAA